MRARLKSIRSDQVPDLVRYAPDPPDAFAVSLVLEVGPLGMKGKERFDLLVVTPKWLAGRHGKKGAVVGHGLLIVFNWNYENIRAFLARQVEACSGPTWVEVARQVARLGDWEGDGDNLVGLPR